MAVNNATDTVYLCMSSPGGMVADGIFLYNHMRSLPVEIITHNTGSICSIAVTVFVGATVRRCSPHGIFLIHPTTIGPFEEGLPWARLDSALKAALADDQRIENILRERAGIPDKALNDRRFVDVYFQPSDAVKYGIAGEVCEFSLPKGNEIIQI